MNRRSKKSKFRSTFEEDVSKILKEFNYEPFTIPSLSLGATVLTSLMLAVYILLSAKDISEMETPRNTPASGTASQKDKS